MIKNGMHTLYVEQKTTTKHVEQQVYMRNY